jgi:DUF971 family protein
MNGDKILTEQLRPTEITADRNERLLKIRWSDGHASNYSFTLLRAACPCAECRGGHDNMGGPPDPYVFSMPDEDKPATRIQNIEAVGAYAFTIAWEDGHHYGIYNWHFLRQLCPCPVCREEADDD